MHHLIGKSDTMAVPDKDVHDMDTGETPGYVDLTEKGPERPISIRHTPENNDEHKKLAEKITVDRDSAENHSFREVDAPRPVSVNNPSSDKIRTASEDDLDSYLCHSEKETYQLKESPLKRKYHFHSLGVSDFPSHGRMKKFKSFEEVKKTVPEKVIVEGKAYEVEIKFIPKTLDQSTTNSDTREMNVLNAGTVDRPPDRGKATVVNCPEAMDGLDKPLDLSASEPLDLRKETSPQLNQALDDSRMCNVEDSREPTLPCMDARNQSLAKENMVPTTQQVIPKEALCGLIVDGNIPDLSALTLTSSVGQNSSGKLVPDRKITLEQFIQLWIHVQQKSAQHGQHRHDGVPPGTSQTPSEIPGSLDEADDSSQIPNLRCLGLADKTGEIFVSDHERVKQGLRAKVKDK